MRYILLLKKLDTELAFNFIKYFVMYISNWTVLSTKRKFPLFSLPYYAKIYVHSKMTFS